MIKRPIIIMAVGLLFSLFAIKPEPVAAQSASAILQEVNQFRVNNGLPPFQYSSVLSIAAQNQAQYMADYQVFSSHTGYGGSSPQSRAAAAGYGGRVTENIVGGTDLTAPRGLTWWINSAVHYNTLITSRYTEAGVGFATDGEINYYVLVVGNPSDVLPANTAASVVSNDPAPLFITPITLATPGEDGSIVHVVQDGQALWSLSAHYDVKLSDLLLYNGLTADSFVNPGDRITIRLPEGVPAPPPPTPPTTHIARDGESLWSIAASYDVRMGDIFWLNGFTEETVLHPGQEVKVRLGADEPPPPTPTPQLTHIVKSGQTMWEIALTYGLTLDDLLLYNNLSADALLQVGMELRIRPPDPPTPTPQPTAVPAADPTVTPEPAPATATPTAIALAMANSAAGRTAVSPIPPTTATNSNADDTGTRPYLIGIGLFTVGLLALGGAGIIVLRKQDAPPL
jgi:LysM repeat protein